MKYNTDILNFWKTEGLNHIKPPRTGEFPEGWDVRDLLVEIIGNDSVNEIGCGYGRLVGKFSTEQYTGYDINHKAILEANKQNPNYNFRSYDIGEKIEFSKWVLFYTVLLHVNDNDIISFLNETVKNCQQVLISEIMGKKWRRPWVKGKPPVFNRDEKDYINIMKQVGFIHEQSIEKPYIQYRNTNGTFMVFRKL